MVDEEAPGVTFYLESANTLPPGNAKMKARARVELSAEIYDEDVYKEVIEKLNNEGKGMRIHTIATFAEEMVDVMRGKLTAKEREAQQQVADKEQEIARLKQQLEFAKAELETEKQAKQLAQEELRRVSASVVSSILR